MPGQLQGGPEWNLKCLANFRDANFRESGQLQGIFAATRLRSDIAEIVEAAGGPMLVRELAESLIVSRGAVEGEPRRTRQARTVLEVKRSMGDPRFQARRNVGYPRDFRAEPDSVIASAQ